VNPIDQCGPVACNAYRSAPISIPKAIGDGNHPANVENSMRKTFGLIATLALALGAGSLSASPPPNGGTISIEASTVDGSYDAAMPSFVDAASAALTARGFTVFEDQGHAASVVELLLSRSDVGTGVGRVAGERTPSIAGAGLALPLGTGNSELVRLQRTRLEMRIHKRGETAIVWDGAAVTVREAGTRNGTDSTVAADLSRALLQSYPVEPKEVVGVP